MMPPAKPILEKLSTPVTASFPSEITSASVATPLSAIQFHLKPEPEYVKTPISPPSAYTDFLTKAMSLNSPAVAMSCENNSEVEPASSTAVGDKLEAPQTSGDGPASAVSVKRGKLSLPTSAPAIPSSPYPSSASTSAPPNSAASFPSLKLPSSPAVSGYDSPLSASVVRSPFSARSLHSVFDWDAALKARYADAKQQKSSRASVRHIREVVTRTVTYTPRMDPAPKGKRRKVE
ncbi:hypothetical protein DCS_03851 [Drechmeria coniospora]|uniref:Uncharacterized protein n=1 Tax=Drechmeria coniospora TaxID=98403 RepID=A0A151GIA0_DRECN|nr:hypothetical protein DCS_03851 [Drechmeria coniospora]KYK56845.1 hypothetical protein DCS_03851 [Drechmeria coniospora]ODA78333.1 hypothetical protein RJ55_05714 [Drechmeria coniospora]